MMDIAKLTKTVKSKFLKSLACYISCFCKKNKEQRMREKITGHFEDKLDIRSFVSVNTNLALMLSLLFTKE